MNRFIVSYAALAALLITGPAAAEGFCLKVFGKVKLTPDPSCAIIEAHADFPIAQPQFLGALGVPDSCFKVKLRGILRGTGAAGLTAEPVLDAGGTPVAATPVALAQGANVRQVLSARSVLDLPFGSVAAADTILIAPGTKEGEQFVTEQLVGTAGTELFENSTANIVINGDAIGKWVPYFGEVCAPGLGDD